MAAVSILNPKFTDAVCSDPEVLLLYDALGLNKLICEDAADYYTSDEKVIAHRLAVFEDIGAVSELPGILDFIHEKINEYTAIKNSRDVADTRETMFRSLIEMKYYTDIVEYLKKSLSYIGDRLTSAGWRNFRKFILDEADSPQFKALIENVNALDRSVTDIKSVTIGVNLDSQMLPTEAGLLAVNNKPFKSGELIDRLLRLEFKDDEYNCLAPLTSIVSGVPYNKQILVNNAILNAMDTAMRDSLKKCRAPSAKLLAEKMQFLMTLKYEIGFLRAGSRFISEMRAKGAPMTTPKLTSSESGDYRVADMYPPQLVMSRGAEAVTPNSVVFDRAGRLFILTGPNSGGKSVFLNALGSAQALLQLGLPVPAKAATMTVCDRVFTHFVADKRTDGYGDNELGRLEAECSRAADIVKNSTEKSMVLLDETFSSTSAEEATELAVNLIGKLRANGCKCVYSTHLHRLGDELPALNADCSLPAVDSLSALTNGSTRTFKIARSASDGTSRAKDIASKYGF